MDRDQQAIYESYTEGFAKDAGKLLGKAYDRIKTAGKDFTSGFKDDQDDEPKKPRRRPETTIPNLPVQLAPLDGTVDNYKHKKPISSTDVNVPNDHPIRDILGGKDDKPVKKPEPLEKPVPPEEPETPKKTETPKGPESSEPGTFKDYMTDVDGSEKQGLSALKSMIDAHKIFPKLRNEIAARPEQKTKNILEILADPDTTKLPTPFGDIDVSSVQSSASSGRGDYRYFLNMLKRGPNDKTREPGQAGIPPERDKLVPAETMTMVDPKYIWLSYIYQALDRRWYEFDTFNNAGQAKELINRLITTGKEKSIAERNKIKDFYGFDSLDNMWDKIAHDVGHVGKNINNRGYKFNPDHFTGN